ncbi:MAG: hypothetical protein AAB654_06580, partial [Acidobacteriota bacterium]
TGTEPAPNRHRKRREPALREIDVKCWPANNLCREPAPDAKNEVYPHAKKTRFPASLMPWTVPRRAAVRADSVPSDSRFFWRPDHAQVRLSTVAW